MNVPKTVLQDGVQRWYEKAEGNGDAGNLSFMERGGRRPRESRALKEGAVCTACRCGAGGRTELEDHVLMWRWQESDLEGSVSVCRCWQEW